MAEVTFHPLHPWALLPEKPKADRAGARAERDAYQDSFRYLRIPRLPADCPPWVLGQELGWSLRSPLTLTMRPLEDIGLAVPDAEDPQQAGRRLGGQRMFQRGKDWIATKDASWLHLGDYRTRSGSWEGMFIPNGQGTVEWRLGFAAQIPAGTFLMVMPPPSPSTPGPGVPLGVIPAKAVNAMAERGGMSIAVQPDRPTPIQRGQEIARLVLLHPDSLRATAHTPHDTAAQPAPSPADTGAPHAPEAPNAPRPAP
ncbi:hypothetical protein ACFYM2_33935 [Streptomyces sp. NPDC006711]|uniref:hypothetical protein n=1 Tax=Streptomyces sp. NPDC006711 TaxID=3364762 RepID=UPI0036BC6E9B